MTDILIEIEMALEELSVEEKQVYARRDTWQQVTKHLIRDSLQEILKSCRIPDRKLFVDEGRKYENFELVQLRFGSVPSGLRSNTMKGSSEGVSEGAVLVFGQSEFGEIGITRYPFISIFPDNKSGERGAYHIGTFKPEDFTRDFVLSQAKDFIVWASQNFSTHADDLMGNLDSRNDPNFQLPSKQGLGFLPPPIKQGDHE